MIVFPPFLQKIMFLLMFFLSVTAVVTIFYTLFNNVNQTQQTQQQIVAAPTTSPTYPPTIFPTETPAPTVEIEPTNNISPTDIPVLPTIPTMSTVGWRNVSNNGVSFLVPPDALCADSDENCNVVITTFEFEGQPIDTSYIISVEPYQGGPRREQFIAGHEKTLIESCNPLFVEAAFGSVDALQIAVSGCYDSGGILTVVGDKLVTFYALSYNPNTKEIERSALRDTIISTLRN